SPCAAALPSRLGHRQRGAANSLGEGREVEFLSVRKNASAAVGRTGLIRSLVREGSRSRCLTFRPAGIVIRALQRGPRTLPPLLPTGGARVGDGEVTMKSLGWLTAAIRAFQVNVPENALVDLRQRIAATRWPDRETVTDRSQGAQLAEIATEFRAAF